MVQIEAFNWYRRYSNGIADPTGTALSVIAVLLMLVTGWRRRVAVADDISV